MIWILIAWFPPDHLFASRCEPKIKVRSGPRRLGRAKKIRADGDGLGGPQKRGRTCRNMRSRIETILWILPTGAPWRDLPDVFAKWRSVHDWFRAWTEAGLGMAIWKAFQQRRSG
ncbi:MAG: transposase [Burkholderiales bacterium]|nr:transposase [Opitutaceae bacterium]